jgi:hypothetical protein
MIPPKSGRVPQTVWFTDMPQAQKSKGDCLLVYRILLYTYSMQFSVAVKSNHSGSKYLNDPSQLGRLTCHSFNPSVTVDLPSRLLDST